MYRRAALPTGAHAMVTLLAVLLLFVAACPVQAQDREAATFTNPLLPSGPDPWNIYHEGYYYYMHTLGDRIDLWKTKSLTGLPTAERKTIWKPPAGTLYSHELWAPEIHFIRGKWYVYVAADDGNNHNHRMYVLENAAADPMKGTWEFKGKISDPSDKWAIDGTVFEHRGQLYFAWSGWEGDENGQQDIYIAKMKNPWTIKGERVRISSPVYEWERHGTEAPPHVAVNEGPQILKHKDKLFLIYSASGCWTDFYALGMLTARENSDLLDSASWEKAPEPVFESAPEKGVHAPGHNSFFRSPDGQEDWILYHANPEPGKGCGNFRSPRAQRFNWNADGTPDFGEPVKPGTPIPVPSEN